MDRSELEKKLVEVAGNLAERALLSLLETAERVLAGDRNGASRRAEEAARRQKLQSAADLSALKVKQHEADVQARLERKKEAAKDKAAPKVPVEKTAPAEPKKPAAKDKVDPPKPSDAKDPAG